MSKIKFLRITARHDGFRRAGIEHRATPVDHPLDSLTKDQIAQLKGEPGLVVIEVEIDGPAEGASEGSADQAPAPKKAAAPKAAPAAPAK